MNDEKRKLGRNFRVNIILLLLFTVVMLCVAVVARRQLMDNARETNTLLVHTYAASEQAIVNTYRNLLTLCTNYIADKESENASIDEIKSGLYPYLDGFSDLYVGDSIRAIGIIDGQVISNDPDFEGFDDGRYDYKQTDWYQGAMEADGEIYMSDAYEDYTTGKNTVTIAKKVDGSDSVFLFDIFFDTYHTGIQMLDLPDNGAYYLCDAKGTVLFYATKVYNSFDTMQEFTYRMVGNFAEGEESMYVERYIDGKGKVRSAFLRRLDNGWVLIMSIPRTNVTGGMLFLYLAIGIGFLLGAAVITYLAVREYINGKKNKKLQQKQEEMQHTTQIYQKTMRSTMQIFREVCYVDLEKNRYVLVYPESTNRVRKGNYEEGLAALFRAGVLSDDDTEQAQQLLSVAHIREALADREYIEIRCRYQDKSGEMEECVVSITVADRKRGRVGSVTLAIRSIEDILRKEEAQRELLELSAQRAEAANRAKSDFLSTMSHDLRTPMNAIIGMASIAQMHTDEPERVADSLNKILLSGERLLGIINSVLDMSKIESGNVILEEKPLSLPAFLEEMAEMFKTQTREKNLKFRLQIDPMEHENVIGDEQRISRIVTNIMGNAIKYTQAGGTVSLHAAEKPSDVTGRGCYQLVFEDTGIGMEQSFVDQIFEPFSRAADSRTTATEGSGLGMSIALGLARMMGGDIRVESRPGEGSTFTVTLYLKINDSLDEAAQSRDAGDKKNIMLEDFAKADYTGKRALLVDDNELNIEVAQEILEMTGISVETAVNGQEAVDMITQKPEHYFDIVFMDIQMPVKNGYEATAAIRASGREDLKRIPIIAITADAFAEDIKKANQAGMNDHIAKPIDFAKLEIVLREWVQESGKV